MSKSRNHTPKRTEAGATTTEVVTLARKVTKCRACPLRRGCSGPLGGVGRAGAKVMVVEQAPNWEDDREQSGFVSVSGQLVVQGLVRHGLKYSDLYLTYLVKCWPNQTRAKKGGVPDFALARCQDYLVREYEMVKPAVIVALGDTVQKFFGIKGGIKQNNGKLHDTAWGPVITIMAPGSIFKQMENLPQFTTQLAAVVTYLHGGTPPPPYIEEAEWVD